MFLKRLESVGFKSFAERIQVEFVPGVTAVVGPNGSGKSNIIDAIRWVLGEQSARSLRGKKMEDIIFQGSETRNALNFAEVALILNNHDEKLPIDYNEVNITRRVYRSGESEFFINKQPCRLKDIVDLFMDTGLGRESFSIIGQGKIDEILSSKAEERRAIFEEAAGVLKYKQRKNQAQFKLTETEDNLDRVEDIIHEIEQQIEPLKEQATTAKKYQEKKAELKKVEIALLVTEIEQLHVNWKQLLSEIEEKKLIEVEKKTIIQKREAALAKERQDIQNLEREIDVLQNDLLTLTEQLEQFEGKRNVWKERLKHLQENKQKLLQEKELKTERIEQVKKLIKTENEKFQAVTNHLEKSLAEKVQLERKLAQGLDELNEQIEDLKSDYIEYLNEQAVLQNDKQTIESQLEKVENKANSESHDYQHVIEKEEKLSALQKEAESTIKKLIDNIDHNEQALLQAEERLSKQRDEYEVMQQKLYEGNEQIATITSRKEMLEEMKESFQGYFYGVKEILQASKENRLAKIHGAVVDLIDVPTEYMTAIDTILGAQAQHVVVPNDQVAREVIQWLKKENKGRATFLPIESIEARTIPDRLIKQLEKQPGFIGIASDLVNTEDKYLKVVEHLMGNVILTEDLRHASAVAGLTNRRYRIVTLDGDVVFPGGSMSGGAKKKANQSLFTREKEIVLLSEKLERFYTRRDSFIEDMNNVKNSIQQQEEWIKQKEVQQQELNETLQKEQKKQNELAIKLQSATDELATYRLNNQLKKEEALKLRTDLKNVTSKLEEIQMKIKNIEQTIEKLTAEQEEIQNNKRNIENRLHELQVTIAEQEERKKSLLERITSLNSQLTEQENEYKSIVSQLNELVETEKDSTTETQIAKEIENYKNKREYTVNNIELKQADRKRKIQLTEDEEREIKQLYKLHDTFVQEIQEKEVQANRLDVTLENHLSFLQTEYIITYEKASQQYEKVTDIEAAKQKVDEMKRSIKQLGTVNLGAIDEYERLSERYTFLTEQKQDLVDAKNTLYSVINEMDQEMTERFSAMFSEIQAAFTVVFQQLFGGGHAELQLTEPDNILETGIEIVARPPGKKLRTLGLLSGGERALTAIALLFAILRARPVPFCILDEVDAALDEANVERFGSYLKRFSEETQFIVITHRKGTMEEADALYGVTMQESGVSRLVSVKLEDTTDLVEAT